MMKNLKTYSCMNIGFVYVHIDITKIVIWIIQDLSNSDDD